MTRRGVGRGVWGGGSTSAERDDGGGVRSVGEAVRVEALVLAKEAGNLCGRGALQRKVSPVVVLQRSVYGERARLLGAWEI